MTQQFSVPSMSCGHCVSAVTKAVKTLPGVQTVSVDLATKLVQLQTTTTVPNDVVIAAISDAGYEDAAVVA